jgi:hypothetical protein
MSYVLDLEKDFDKKPSQNAFKDEIISFELGHDIEEDLFVLMVVRFVYKEDGVYDLKFGIEERKLSNEQMISPMDYSLEVSKRYVPKPHRARVLEFILQSIQSIVENTKPKKVTMQSFCKSPPEKALL